MLFSIVIPTYNEAKTIDVVLEEIYKNKNNTEVEVIVVNDGSTYNTKDVLEKWQNKIILINKSSNQGKTRAIADAVEIMNGDYIAIQDADNEYNPKDLFNILNEIKKHNFDAVYGSRILKRNYYVSTFYYYGSRFITAYYNLLFKDNLTDLSTGYKVFKKDLINLKKVKSDRFGFCAQVTCLLKKQNVKIVEIPISYNPRTFQEGKKIRLSDGIEFIFIITNQYFSYD